MADRQHASIPQQKRCGDVSVIKRPDDKIAETIRKDLVDELAFLRSYDAAYGGVRAVVDMPNKRISLFVRLTMQNSGKFPKSRRRQFTELSDTEIEAMELAVHAAMLEV